SEEILSAFSFHVREIAARVNAATLWISGGFLDPGRTQLVPHAIESRVLGFWRHGGRLTKPSSRRNPVSAAQSCALWRFRSRRRYDSAPSQLGLTLGRLQLADTYNTASYSQRSSADFQSLSICRNHRNRRRSS